MRRRSYLGTVLLWALLVASLAFLLAHSPGDLYRRPVAAAGQALARLAAPAGVRVDIQLEEGAGRPPGRVRGGARMRFSASRGGKGLATALDLDLLNAAAALLLATALVTPLGGVARLALGSLLALLAFILVMTVLVAGLALVPLVQGGFLDSRLAWRMAALAHNVSTSGLIISFPAAIWFLSTLRWWRRGFAAQGGRGGGGERRGSAGAPARKRGRGRRG